MTEFPPLLDRTEIHRRLGQIFPPGLTNRNYVVREMAASTMFVMLYLGAIEGADYYVKPDQITRMNDVQASMRNAKDRREWRKRSVEPGGESGWYAQNTREPIRDETLRFGLIQHGAALERQDLPTTSPRGRYALTTGFAGLFDPDLGEAQLDAAIRAWRDRTLSPSARARLTLYRHATARADAGVLVTFPNGETRRLAEGPSSVITKGVVEDFAMRFLRTPGVLWISESRTKETYRDAELLNRLGIDLSTDRVLPDVILVDLGSDGEDPLFIFIEVVASDGAVTEQRRRSLLGLITEAGYRAEQAHFVTAYLDREEQAFKSTVSALAWGSVAWFLSEPEYLVILSAGEEQRHLVDLTRR